MYRSRRSAEAIAPLVRVMFFCCSSKYTDILSYHGTPYINNKDSIQFFLYTHVSTQNSTHALCVFLYAHKVYTPNRYTVKYHRKDVQRHRYRVRSAPRQIRGQR